MKKNIWLATRCMEACYSFLYNNIFDVSDSLVKEIAFFGNDCMAKYEIKQKYFFCLFDEVSFFAQNTAEVFSNNYNLDKKMAQGLAVAFMMPYFYWELFINMKVGRR